jgi:hypothetical protein
MVGAWEDDLNQLSEYADEMKALVLNPSSHNRAGLGWSGNGITDYCADKVLAGMDDIEALFNIDRNRTIMTGSSQGGSCTANMMLRNASVTDRFAVFNVAASVPHVPEYFVGPVMWFMSPKDGIVSVFRDPQWVQERIDIWRSGWDLDQERVVWEGEKSKIMDFYSSTDPRKIFRWLQHNYTTGTVQGHCSPGGRDAPPKPTYMTGVRLSCPQPNPKEAEINTGEVHTDYYKQFIGAPGVPLFECSSCEAYGFSEDGCGCGHCGSFGGCSFSCDPSSSYYTGRACRTD